MRFGVRERNRILLVRADTLDAIQAAGNYVELIVEGRRHLLRETLTEMERQTAALVFEPYPGVAFGITREHRAERNERKGWGTPSKYCG